MEEETKEKMKMEEKIENKVENKVVVAEQKVFSERPKYIMLEKTKALMS